MASGQASRVSRRDSSHRVQVLPGDPLHAEVLRPLPWVAGRLPTVEGPLDGRGQRRRISRRHQLPVAAADENFVGAARQFDDITCMVVRAT